MTPLQEHIGRTLWSPSGELLEIIDRTHILNDLWVKWSAGDIDPRSSYITAMPGPTSATRGAENRAGKPMTQPINFVPYFLQEHGPVAIRIGDDRSLQIYNQWRLQIDSLPDYIGAMITRGRYSGRQTSRMGYR